MYFKAKITYWVTGKAKNWKKFKKLVKENSEYTGVYDFEERFEKLSKPPIVIRIKVKRKNDKRTSNKIR